MFLTYCEICIETDGIPLTSIDFHFDKAVNLLQSLATDIGLEFAVYEPAGKPICVLTWPGTESSLPSIMLNSHVDVVEADGVGWMYPPYAAHIDEHCNIYARGAQDSKDLGIQYIEAIRRLKNQNVTLQRTIHVTYMPDEEIGGFQGMREFLKMKKFKELNVGFVLDEGLGSQSDENLYVTYQDKRAWSMKFTVEGIGGHGSFMPKDVAVTKLNRLLNVMIDYRTSLEEAMKSVNQLHSGPYTAMNINMINGGYAPNVIPSSFSLVADMRLATTANATEMLSLAKSWAEYAGNGTKLEFLRREMDALATPVDNSNPYWITLRDTVYDLGFNVTPIVLPATSDSLFVRNYGIPAFGFAPLFNTVQRIHNTNEYINVHVFMRGIEVYEVLIKNLGNLASVINFK
ncbi:hypothetical protein evm_000006 [Chilo suppressalis]|nr:hypothetical protein evm_000006 [Chilo suppressalis]